ncbi:MAG: IclR family transcriptional regulator [Woeseiaceae bacterium]|jgi:DNA-binding IclR family transcriptional regulator|nr:IclR family transcriptional regulator [Woeseiaceae bacterium]MDG1015892.1 IclR family transcriptional regulator [Woeseiaceae bacterium]MDG1712821.1 IclR family transcriptional regulator [Woeseiaceae bacterium]MDG1864867.1 IclR family transcriptional regulator [Woeseiaceae bacterium]|tara:strand:+ start:35 stop:790 length:756 start_codon:yes stop_codon:yes gene_type:complete
MKEKTPPKGAQAALRAIRLLKLFTIEKPDLSLTQVSIGADLNKTTTHRLLRALESENLVQRNSVNGRYSLGAGLMALGVQALSSSDLRRRARPILKLLARDTGETAQLEVPVQDGMLILDEVTGRHVVSATGNIGTHWPMHATSSGKAYIAYDANTFHQLPDSFSALTKNTITTKTKMKQQVESILKRGFSESVDELEPGYSCVGIAVFDALGNIQGALSIGGPSHRMTAERRLEIGVALKKASDRLSPEY